MMSCCTLSGTLFTWRTVAPGRNERHVSRLQLHRANECLELPLRLTLDVLGTQPATPPPVSPSFSLPATGTVSVAPFPHGRSRTSLPHCATLETSSHSFSVSSRQLFPAARIISCTRPTIQEHPLCGSGGISRSSYEAAARFRGDVAAGPPWRSVPSTFQQPHVALSRVPLTTPNTLCSVPLAASSSNIGAIMRPFLALAIPI